MSRTFATPESWKKVGEILDQGSWMDLLTPEERIAMLAKGDMGVTIDVDASPVSAITDGTANGDSK